MGSGALFSTRKGQQARHYLLYFGFTPDIYANNLEILKIDVTKVDALIISCGHYDHIGGLIAFLEANRGRMRKDLRLYTGGEENFCHRFTRNPDDGNLTTTARMHCAIMSNRASSDMPPGIPLGQSACGLLKATTRSRHHIAH